jgi:hypothetical protein
MRELLASSALITISCVRENWPYNQSEVENASCLLAQLWLSLSFETATPAMRENRETKRRLTH